MDYQSIIKRCEESSNLISMVPVEEIVRFGYSMGLNSTSTVLDLCCGYGVMLKIFNEVFGCCGTGVDISKKYIEEGNKSLQKAGIENIRLIEADVLNYEDSAKYDVVICSETFDSIKNTIDLGEKYLREGGLIVYCKLYSKVPNPPKELIDFDGELLPLGELNRIFNSLGYYITHMASDTNGEWERYITWSARRDIARLRVNPNNEKLKTWIDNWYKMYFLYRRPYEGQALFGLEKSK